MVATRLLALYINKSIHLRAGALASERHLGARTYLHSLLGNLYVFFFGGCWAFGAGGWEVGLGGTLLGSGFWGSFLWFVSQDLDDTIIPS